MYESYENLGRFAYPAEYQRGTSIANSIKKYALCRVVDSTTIEFQKKRREEKTENYKHAFCPVSCVIPPVFASIRHPF